MKYSHFAMYWQHFPHTANISAASVTADLISIGIKSKNCPAKAFSVAKTVKKHFISLLKAQIFLLSKYLIVSFGIGQISLHLKIIGHHTSVNCLVLFPHPGDFDRPCHTSWPQSQGSEKKRNLQDHRGWPTTIPRNPYFPHHCLLNEEEKNISHRNPQKIEHTMLKKKGRGKSNQFMTFFYFVYFVVFFCNGHFIA